jgi:type I restriction enzyme S subunit
MNADRLLEQYERIADAPEAVDRLRRFVLDLAVRGKLVAQDATDHPASVLLEKIAVKKTQIAAAGEITHRDTEPLNRNELPFELPIGWQWSRIGEVCSKTGSGSTPRGGKSVYKNRGIPFLRSQNVYDDGLRLEDVAYIDAETHNRMCGTAIRPKDLLLNITGGSIGRCALVPVDFEEANISQHVAIIRPAILGIEGFLHLLIRSPYFQAFIFGKQTGAGRGGLPKNRMDSIPVAVPPLAEQHRIVAKVDELMALCDRLEAARAEREATRDRLAAASLTRLNAPDADTFHDDARFALGVLPAITTRPEQIKQVRQTILNLAVRGKLVPQDPKDEPASELLRRIALRPGTTSVKGKRSTVTLNPTDEIDDALYTCPSSWKWLSAEQLAQTGKSITYGILKPVWVASGIPTVRVMEMKTGVIDVASLPKCDAARAKQFTKTLLAEGDLLISKDGTIGKTAFVPVGLAGGNITQHVLRFSISPEVHRQFVKIVIDSPIYQSWMAGETKGVALQGINVGDFRRMPIPIPPLAEQRRIVAKVDELMALCDRLEASLAISDDTRGRLLDALLHEALSPSDHLAAEQPEKVAAHG